MSRVANTRGVRCAHPPLAVLAVLYLAAQFVLFHLDRPMAWDEAVYLAEVHSGSEAIGFSAHRARGITLLVLPLAVAGSPVPLVRLYLGLLSAALLYWAYAAWAPIVGRTAYLAAGLFASSWLVLFYGTEISPNLFVAFMAVLAGAGVARILYKPSCRRSELHVIIGFAAMSLLRPTDSLAIAMGLALFVLFTRSTARFRVLGATVVGLSVGWFAWAVEAVLRFQGPLQRLRRAAGAVGGGAQNSFIEHLALIEGSLIGPASDDTSLWPGVVWWVAWLLLAVMGFVSTQRGDQLRVVAMTSSAAIALAAPYFVLTGALAPRFLLPTYALAALPVAFGVDALVRRATGDVRHFLVGILGAAAVVWVVWHAGTAIEIESEQAGRRSEAAKLGEVLGEMTQDSPCVFASQYGYPQIAFYSSCKGHRLLVDADSLPRPIQNAGPTVRRFLLTIDDLSPNLESNGLQRVREDQTPGNWKLYEVP